MKGTRSKIKILNKYWYSRHKVIPNAIPNIIVIKCESWVKNLIDIYIPIFDNWKFKGMNELLE